MHPTRLALVVALALVGCTKKPPEPATPDTPVAQTPGDTAEPTPAEPAPEPVLSDKEVRRRLDDAVAQLTVGTPEAARRAFGILDQIARRDQSNAYVFFNLGVAHEQLGEIERAERAYEQAIGIDPELSRAYLGLGVLLEQADRTRDAIDWYRKGIEVDGEDMELRSALIGALRRQGKLDQAIAEARSALAFNSKSLPVYNDLGLVYVEKGDLSMARFVYLKALGQVEGAKNNPSIRTNFGWTLYLQEDRLQARRQLEESYELDKRYLPTLIYLSHLYMDDRNYTDAVPLLEEALSQEPDNYGVVVNLGVAYRGTGQLDQAKAMYEKALELQPTAPEPHRNLGILHGDYFKDYDAAIQQFDTYLDKGGPDTELIAEYKADVEKERERAERKRQREEERKRREQEKLERQRLLDQAEREAAASGGGDAPPADDGAQPADGTPPADDTEPPPAGGDSPWGPQ